MAIHGSATIELTNADGSKEIIKHDNMVTNAVSDMCMSYRGDIASILKIMSYGESYANALFGGILLFDEVLNDDPDDYVIPSTNITGYASQDAYGGLDIARGSFNQSESGVQADGSYKFVWDFSTSQANGTIKSVALCPNIMGQIGASDYAVSSERKDFYVKNGLKDPFYANMLPSGGFTNGIANYNFEIVGTVGDIAYAIDATNIQGEDNYQSLYIVNNGGILRLHKFRIGVRKISLADNVCTGRYLGYEDVTIPSEFIDILYNDLGNRCLDTFFDYESGKLILYPFYKKSEIQVNGTTKYAEIELKNNMNVTVYTFTNNTAGYIDKGYGYKSAHEKGCTLFICKNYIVNFSVVGKETKMYVTNRNDNTIVRQVKYSNGNEYKFSATSNICFIPLFAHNNILFFSYEASSSGGYYYVLDMSTGIIKRTNAENMSFGGYTMDIGSKVVYACSGKNLSYNPVINPFVLTTKNNLGEPVVKTSSQTMKITYTLTESEGA